MDPDWDPVRRGLADALERSTFVHRESDGAKMSEMFEDIRRDLLAALRSPDDRMLSPTISRYNSMLIRNAVQKRVYTTNPDEQHYLTQVGLKAIEMATGAPIIQPVPLIEDQFDISGDRVTWVQRNFYNSRNPLRTKLTLKLYFASNPGAPVFPDDGEINGRLRDEFIDLETKYHRGRDIESPHLEHTIRTILDGQQTRLDAIAEIFESSRMAQRPDEKENLYARLAEGLGVSQLKRDTFLDTWIAKRPYPVKDGVYSELMKVVKMKPTWLRGSVALFLQRSGSQYPLLDRLGEWVAMGWSSFDMWTTALNDWYIAFEMRSTIGRTAKKNPTNKVYAEAFKQAQVVEAALNRLVYLTRDIHVKSAFYAHWDTLFVYYLALLEEYAFEGAPLNTLSHMVELMLAIHMYALAPREEE